jgi:hypothetical protein
MGNWQIQVEGHGVHDNGLGHDAEQRLKEFVEQLLADGHDHIRATFTLGSVREFVPATPDKPAGYRYL